MAASGGSFVAEIWDGGAWVQVGCMASSVAELYRYASQVFIRANSEENVQLGIDETTTWATQTILGTTAYWMRWRIATAATTAPVWERVRLEESSKFINRSGQLAARGLARWRSQLLGVGNAFGPIGGAGSVNVAVGTGAQPTGWSHRLEGSNLNGIGDAIGYHFQIPDGLCTAFPLTIELFYSLTGTAPITAAPSVIVSVLVLRTGGVDIADPAGAIVPIPRPETDAETFTSKAATFIAQSTPLGTFQDSPQKLSFGPFDVSDYYTGDQVILAVELDDDGTPNQDLQAWSLVANAVRFQLGEVL